MTNMGVDKRFKQVISSCDHVSSVFQSQFSFWTQILLDSKVIFDKQKFPSLFFGWGERLTITAHHRCHRCGKLVFF